MEPQIECSFYEGYIWYSDQSVPEFFQNKEKNISLEDNQNPFIVEGYLYDRAKEVSYSIKYIDGKYRVKRFYIPDLKELEKKEYVFLPKRMSGIKGLLFEQYWRPVEDAYCESMPVLQPAEYVFKGFQK